MQVRYATPSDMDFVTPGGNVPVDWMFRRIDAREVVVAERGGMPVGFARYEHWWAKTAFLALIQVMPEERRRGVGRAMLEFLEAELAAAGLRVLMSSAEVENAEGMVWHRSMGFVECGRATGLEVEGLDEVYFRKQLRAYGA